MNADGHIESTQVPQATPLSRVARFVLGLLLVLESMRIFWIEDAVWIVKTVAAAAAVVVFYTLVHYLVSTFVPHLNRWIGTVLAVAPVAVFFFFGPSWARVAALLFVGISLVLIAFLGDPGCEVMAIPSLVFGKRTDLACIIFTPMDWVEQKAAKWASR